jgi:endo-1,4-beta-xylanase
MRKAVLRIGFVAVLAGSCSAEQPAPRGGADGGTSGAPAAGSGAPSGTGGVGGSRAGIGGAGSGHAGVGVAGTAGSGVGNVGGVSAGGTSSGGSTAGDASLAGSPNAGAPTAGMSGFAGASGSAGDGGAPSAGASGGGGMAAGGAAGGCNAGSETSLHQKYQCLFSIGAAVDSQSYMTHRAVLTQHFNSITAENEMKFESLQPSQGQFTYSAADNLVNFAMQNDMKVRGHALVWHTQNPSWLFSGASRDTLLARMRSHISNVVTHFKGKVYAWDVVNEAIMEDGSYRDGNEDEGKQSQWYAIIGEDYIAEAFRAAHEADPDAKLFYNDFYNYIPAKVQGIYSMLQGLLADGVPVHGVGLQAHLNIEPSTDPNNQAYHQHVENMEDAIELYASLGLEVQVTEMDVSLYIPGIMYTSDMFYTEATFTDALETQQAERYRAFFDMFRRHASTITGVTFWGIADDNTWLSEFSSGRKDFPLLFDVRHEKKKAYDAVVDF